jgi:hypothetical protein
MEPQGDSATLADFAIGDPREIARTIQQLNHRASFPEPSNVRVLPHRMRSEAS